MSGLPLTLAQVVIHKRKDDCVNQNGFCPKWIGDHLGDYVDPFLKHLELVVISVVAGFLISFALALLARRRRWLVPPITAVTGILYTLPSLALFFLLVPITGFGTLTAVIPLTAYTLLIIFRNIVTGFDGVPAEARDAARGMGMTDRQLLWRVEIPLALPSILTGVRIAATSTVGLAALAFAAGAGGLGQQLVSDVNFKSNVVVAGGLCVLLAAALELLLLGAERLALPWKRAVSGG
jgi:osmoprotectant transport system permease protein